MQGLEPYLQLGCRDRDDEDAGSPARQSETDAETPEIPTPTPARAPPLVLDTNPPLFDDDFTGVDSSC